jgi:hypothetical protein
MIASVANHGKARWMVVDAAFNHAKPIEFFGVTVAPPAIPTQANTCCSRLFDSGPGQ